MASTVASIGCSPTMTVQPDHQKRVEELTDIITRYLPYLHRMALRRLGSVADAEDVVQDTLLSALTHVDQFRGQAQMSTWVTSILINCVRMKLRRRTPQSYSPLDAKDQERDDLSVTELVQDCRPGPEEICREWEFSELVVRSMKRLSPPLRQTLTLRGLCGLSIRETANALRVPEGTAKARIARARTRLKQMVEEHVDRNRERSHGLSRPRQPGQQHVTLSMGRLEPYQREKARWKGSCESALSRNLDPGTY